MKLTPARVEALVPVMVTLTAMLHFASATEGGTRPIGIALPAGANA